MNQADGESYSIHACIEMITSQGTLSLYTCTQCKDRPHGTVGNDTAHTPLCAVWRLAVCVASLTALVALHAQGCSLVLETSSHRFLLLLASLALPSPAICRTIICTRETGTDAVRASTQTADEPLDVDRDPFTLSIVSNISGDCFAIRCTERARTHTCFKLRF